MKSCLIPAAAFLLLIPAASAQAPERPSPYDLLGKAHEKPLVTIDTVPVGNPNNAKDKETGYGAVAHEFAMGKIDVTVAQTQHFSMPRRTFLQTKSSRNSGVSKCRE